MAYNNPAWVRQFGRSCESESRLTGQIPGAMNMSKEQRSTKEAKKKPAKTAKEKKAEKKAKKASRGFMH